MVAAGHHHLHLLCPVGAQFKHAPVYLHGYRTRVCHYHRLAAAYVLAVLLIVVYDVCHEVVDGHVVAQQGIHVRHLFLVFLKVCLCCSFVSQLVILGVYLGEYLVIELQLYHAAFVIHRARSTVIHRLRHVIYVDVVAEHLACVPVLV